MILRTSDVNQEVTLPVHTYKELSKIVQSSRKEHEWNLMNLSERNLTRHAEELHR